VSEKDFTNEEWRIELIEFPPPVVRVGGGRFSESALLLLLEFHSCNFHLIL